MDNPEHVCETIQSLRSNCFLSAQEVEVILVDSSMIYQSRIEDICALNGINYHWETPTGIYSAMNFGSRQAKGIYLWFLNPGDLAVSNATSVLNCVDHASRKLASTILFRTETVDENGAHIRFRNQKIVTGYRRFLKLSYCHQGIMYSSQLFDSGHYFSERFRLLSDKIYNDRWVALDKSHVCSLLIAKFFTGGLSSSSRDIRREMVRYLITLPFFWFR